MPENAKYRGAFLIGSGTAAVGVLGITGGGFVVPSDLGNPLHPKEAYGSFIGYAAGADVSATVALVYYTEWATYNWQEGTFRMNVGIGYVTFDFDDLTLTFE